MQKSKIQRINIEFERNLIKLYPNEKSIPARTKRLNSVLEELLYGTKNK